MKAAIVTAPGTTPIYAEFRDPKPQEGLELVHVTAAALTNLTKGRAAGSHYSADNSYPFVPGIDGTGTTDNGRRVYFAMPEAPFGAMAEQTLVDPRRTIPLPNALDDVTAAAIANPGMSCWAALVLRAHLQPGETVLVNGATGSAGVVAVQLARHLGAKRVIATGRNRAELDVLLGMGADAVIPFDFSDGNTGGAKEFEKQLTHEFTNGIEVVIDYLWGPSALSILTTIARAVEEAHPVRFVQVGSSSGDSIPLPGAALRSSAVQLMGSGLKSVPMSGLLDSIRHTFDLAAQGILTIATKTAPLSSVADTWSSPGTPRLVYTT